MYVLAVTNDDLVDIKQALDLKKNVRRIILSKVELCRYSQIYTLGSLENRKKGLPTADPYYGEKNPHKV